jgi:hypothetical protein
LRRALAQLLEMLSAGFDFDVACHVRLLSKDGVIGSVRSCRGEAAGKDRVKAEQKTMRGRLVSATRQSNKNCVMASLRMQGCARAIAKGACYRG